MWILIGIVLGLLFELYLWATAAEDLPKRDLEAEATQAYYDHCRSRPKSIVTPAPSFRKLR